MNKFPLQSVIAAALLAALAFSVHDESSAQPETRNAAIQLSCTATGEETATSELGRPACLPGTAQKMLRGDGNQF